MLQSSVTVPIDSLSFPLVDPALCLELHRKRDNVVRVSAMVGRSDDFLPAHRTLGNAFSGLGTLIFAGYEGFHEAGVAEEVTLKRTELVFVMEAAQKEWLTAVGGCQIFHVLHADNALQCRQFHGFIGLFFLCLDGSHSLLLENFG